MLRKIDLRFAFLLGTVCITLAGCGSSSTQSPPPAPLTFTLGSSSILVRQDGGTTSVTVTVSGYTANPSVTVTGMPAGMTGAYTATSESSGLIGFTGGAGTVSGTYTATVNVASGTATASRPLTIVSAPVVAFTGVAPTSSLEQFMSTSFQIAQWTGDIFGSGSTAAARETELTNIGGQHLRMQIVAGGMPMVSNTGTAADWDFTTADTTVQPVLASADHSPEFQIATAPAWMCNANGQLDVANHAQDFAQYAANLVRYYNKGGFDWGGQHFQSPSSTPITWWGIFNEYSINGLSATDYVTLYDATVPAMLAVDPTIKLSALEFSDFGLGSGDEGDPMQYLPTFFGTNGTPGVTSQVDIVSTHFYSTCNQTDTDATLFSTIPQFVQNVQYFYQVMGQAGAKYANTPVWVTENNVNADYEGANGMSTCNPGQVFVDDHRGTSAFFAAWRPYVFSQLGKAGNHALYQWDYSGDQQYGEVDANSNQYLSYWVDQTLASYFPSTPSSPGPQILPITSTDTTTIETLATKNSDGSIVLMIVDRAVHSPTDNNGTGDPRTVIVDLPGVYTSASLLTIDATTNASSGPTITILPTNQSYFQIQLNGYGVAFLKITP
jgi:hypothetical protein